MKEGQNIPGPDEIKEEFEQFIKDKFGANIEVVTHMEGPFAKQEFEKQKNLVEETKDEEININFDYKPKDIKDYLDRFVIGQDEAKKALAIAVCDHYNYVKAALDTTQEKLTNYSKQNVLLLGPTGVGKTYLVRMIANLMGVPFVKADATRFTETGYVGANVEDVIKDLVQQANGNLDLAQYGIVYIDEGDKLAAPTGSSGRDVGGRGVQFSLLKLMEETDIDLASPNDMMGQMQAFMDLQRTGKPPKKMINTKHILFIISGAFTGIDDIISKRLKTRQIGFTKDPAKRTENSLKDLATKDLIDFGFEPEFVGRLPIRVSCNPLKANDLFKILKDSEGSIIKQYIAAFNSYGIAIDFTDKALQKIADISESEKTGARALMTILEKLLRDYKFFLPTSKVKKFTITEELIESPDLTLKALIEKSEVEYEH